MVIRVSKWLSATVGVVATVLAPASWGADVSVGSLTWSSVGSTGLIASDYDPTGEDAILGSSPTGNLKFGYVSTAYRWGAADENGNPADLGFVADPVTNVSPLTLLDSEPGYNQTNGAKVVSSSFTAAAGQNLTMFFNYVSTDGRTFLDFAWARLVSAASNETAAYLFTAQSARKPDAGANDGDYVPGKVLTFQPGYDGFDSKDPNRKVAATLNDGVPVIGVESANTQWAPLGPSAGQCWDVGTSCGYTGWVKSSYQVQDDGLYYLEIGVNNWGDTAFQSALAFDFTGLDAAGFGNINQFENVTASPVPLPASWILMVAGLGMTRVLGRRRKQPG